MDSQDKFDLETMGKDEIGRLSGSLLCVTSPCFSHEPDDFTPEYFMFDAPDFIEFYAMHSPDWWNRHFSKYKNVSVLSCGEHPLGREIWLDSIRWQLKSRPLKDALKDAKMLLMDQKRFVTYFSLLARISYRI